MTSETNNKPSTMKGECYMNNNDLILTATSFELSLTPGHPVILWNPDAFNDFALIECKTKRTHITLIADTKDLENFEDELAEFGLDFAQNEEAELTEDLEGFAKGFPDWDLHPPIK